ncbi:hypothetical protein KCU88_g5708, partial [Aureobasidium melanogenum]
MSGVEIGIAVIGAVAALVTAYKDAGGIVAKIKERRNARGALPPSVALEESLDEGHQEIERITAKGIKRFGADFEQGDDIAHRALQSLTIEVQASLLRHLTLAVKDDSVTDFEACIDSAIEARLKAVTIFNELYLRQQRRFSGQREPEDRVSRASTADTRESRDSRLSQKGQEESSLTRQSTPIPVSQATLPAPPMARKSSWNVFKNLHRATSHEQTQEHSSSPPTKRTSSVHMEPPAGPLRATTTSSMSVGSWEDSPRPPMLTPPLSPLPGYGISTPIEDRSRNDKRSVGTALLEALSKVFNTTATSSSSPRRIILGGHDRGARIAHRLAVDFSHPPSDSSSSLFQTLNLTVIGTVLMDIIPTLSQWQAFSDPKTVTGYFHWPLLANADLATAMITAYWGGHWCREALKRIAGSNPQSWDRIASNNALDIYGVLFAKRDTIYYSSLDYEAGATTDVTQQEEDQQAGRKIEVPLLVLYSKAKLGATVDVEAVWRDWIQPPPEGSGSESNHFYEAYGVGDGYGHYLPEEAYDIVGEKIAEFLKKVA